MANHSSVTVKKTPNGHPKSRTQLKRLNNNNRCLMNACRQNGPLTELWPHQCELSHNDPYCNPVTSFHPVLYLMFMFCYRSSTRCLANKLRLLLDFWPLGRFQPLELVNHLSWPVGWVPWPFIQLGQTVKASYESLTTSLQWDAHLPCCYALQKPRYCHVTAWCTLRTPRLCHYPGYWLVGLSIIITEPIYMCHLQLQCEHLEDGDFLHFSSCIPRIQHSTWHIARI